MSQKILKKDQLNQLRLNSAAACLTDTDPYPVVKFFNPCGASTWLITEMEEDGRMFGLCDLGYGTPELGYVMLDDLTSQRLQFGLKIERDIHFKANKPLSEYASEARQKGSIAA